MLCSTSRAERSRADACADAYEGAQVSRIQKDLAKAREQLVVCQRTCPDALAARCAEWTAELDAKPSVILISARAPDGRVLSQVRLSINGALPTAVATGEAIPLQHGARHTLRFETEGAVAVTEIVELAESERRQLVVAFRAADSDAGINAPPVVSYGLGGVGIVALAVGGVLFIKGQLDLNELEDTCSPNCSQSDEDGVERTWLAGGIVAGAGGALLAAAVLFWVFDPPPDAVEVGPRGLRFHF